MSTVRAKFFVSKVEPREGATAAMVTMGAVCRGVENAMWAQYTPSANLTMYVKNDAATAQFEEGEEYEVTFTKVAKPRAGDGHALTPVETKDGGLVCEVCGAQYGFTAKAVEERPYLAQYATEEALAAARTRHDEVFGKKG